MKYPLENTSTSKTKKTGFVKGRWYLCTRGHTTLDHKFFEEGMLYLAVKGYDYAGNDRVMLISGTHSIYSGDMEAEFTEVEND